MKRVTCKYFVNEAEPKCTKYFHLTGNCLLAVEFLPTSGAALAINKKGSVKVSVKFRSATTQNLTAIVLCMYQAIIEIHPDKTVSIN